MSICACHGEGIYKNESNSYISYVVSCTMHNVWEHPSNECLSNGLGNAKPTGKNDSNDGCHAATEHVKYTKDATTDATANDADATADATAVCDVADATKGDDADA